MTHSPVELVVRPGIRDREHLLDDADPLIDPDSVGDPVQAVGHGLNQRQRARLAHVRDAGLTQLHGQVAAAVETQHHPVVFQRMPVPQRAEIETLDRLAGTLLPTGSLIDRIAHLLGCGAGDQHSGQHKYCERGCGAGERNTDALFHSGFSGKDGKNGRDRNRGNDGDIVPVGNRDSSCIDRESAWMTHHANAIFGDRRPMRQCIAAATLGLLSLAATAADLESIELPAGPGAMAPRLAVDRADGRVLLSWLEPDESGHALRFSSFIDGAFTEPRTVARGTDWFVNWADTPGLHPAPDGSWTAHWLARSADSTYAYDIELARSQDRGASWARLPNPHRDGTRTEHGFVSHFPDAAGGLGLVWLDGRNTAPADGAHEHAGAMSLRSATIGSDGQVTESVELDRRVCDCCQTASASTAAGPVVVYRDRSPDEIRDIAILRRVDGRWTEPELVHADGWKIGGCPVNGPALAADLHALAVAWFTMAADHPTVKIAFSSDAGANFATPQEFSPGAAIGRVDLIRHDLGWAMSWMEQTEEQGRLQLARFDDDGSLLDRRELTRLDGGRISGFPRIAFSDGRLLVVWTGSHHSADSPHSTQLQAAIHRFP